MSIDHIIRSALKQIEAKKRQADWDTFIQKMEENELAEFDKSVKSHLSGLSASSNHAWERFEDKYADQLSHSHPVDKTIKSNLADHEPPFDESHWLHLRSLLDLTEIRERNILIQKCAEIGSISFLLFIVLPIIFSTPEHANKALIYEKKDEIAEEGGDKSFAQPSETMSFLHTAKTVKKKSHTLSVIPVPSPTKQKGNKYVTPTPKFAQNQERTTPETLSAQDRELAFSNKQNHISQLKSKIIQISKGNQVELNSLPLNHLPAEVKKAIEENFLSAEAKTIAWEGSSLSNQVGLLPPTALSITDPSEVTPLPQISIEGPVAESGLSLQPIVVSQFIHVHSPYDPVYDVKKSNQITTNLGWGLELEKQKGSRSIGGSLVFSRLTYQPPTVTEIFAGNLADGYTAIRLNEIDFQMLNATLFIRQYFARNSRLTWFGHFGGGLQMALHASYQIELGSLAYNGTIQHEIDPNEELFVQPKLLEEKDFHDGLMDGGSFNQNSFMHLNMGIGFTYELYDKLYLSGLGSIQLSPFTDGLGPNRDQFQQFCLQLGLKYTM